MSPVGWRSRAVILVVTLGWCVLAGRLVHLQWFHGADLARRAARQSVFYEDIPARPGDLIDRDGRLLATTVQVRSLYVVPNRIDDPAGVARRLAQILSLNAVELTERIAARRDRAFLWVKRRLSDSEVERLRQLNLPEDVWGLREEYQRRYPQGALAAHVVGMRDIDGVGRGGLEESLDPILRGSPGRRVLIRDARGRVVEVADDDSEPPRPGRSVVLTLDTVLQLYVERSLDELTEAWKPESACALVLDPNTGEVLAMASRPTFDPNAPDQVADDAWRNRAIADLYEPGSTFKPFVVAWGIENGLLDPEESFDCEHGEYRMGGRLLHDHHPYGRLSVTDILVKSSNIGMAKIGERMGNAELYRAAVTFGFGRKTGVELPGELAGVLRPLKHWNRYSTGSIPMGHELATTPLQLLAAHAALANGGTWIAPHLVQTQEHEHPVVTASTVSSDTCDWLVTGPMVDVVNRGTGRRARIPGYRVFGKTGTAQKLDPATGQYSSEKHVSSFLCGAPADDPRVLVLVVVNEPAVGNEHFGGTIAAPAAADILRNALVHLRVPYDERLLKSAWRLDPETVIE